MKKFVLFLVVLSVVFSKANASEAFAPLFPFAISSEAPDNVVNLSSWNEAPAGKHGFIRIEDGRFVHDRGRFLIWGTNLCFSACFPEKDQAEKLAARLARFGFNCVRLHHMDNRDIWGGSKAKSPLTLDPDQLDKLDYLIHQLKEHGIYVNINLHVSRWMDERDGFSDKKGRPDYDKGVDHFYQPLIDVRKQYARDLLAHVNPYTKTAYFEEPAVAMIEISNENSVVAQWHQSGKLTSLPDPEATEFRKRWNEFLRKKYASTARLAEAWESREEPLGDEMLRTGLESQKWYLETDRDTQCKAVQDGDVFRLEVGKKGSVDWHPQLIAGSLKFEEGNVYTFSVRARADQARSLSLYARMARAPWEGLGLQQRIELETDWKTFTIPFVASRTEEKARFDIGGFGPGVFELAGASLKPGGRVGLGTDETLEAGTVPIVLRDDARFPCKAVEDFCEFLFAVEDRYWIGMYRFLKDELKVRQPVSGTQLGYGSTTIQAKLDYLDIHAYWNHPHFPGRPWDGNNWTVRNRALVNHLDRGVLPRLATARVHGKPYTVSEFDAPFPNEYAAEALPILAAFGRFQDWDGLFHFAYSHDKNNLEAKRVTGFFDMVGNTVKLAHLPACVAMFRRGDVEPGNVLVLGNMTPEQELDIFKRNRSCWRLDFRSLGIDPTLALIHRTALDLTGKTTEEAPDYASDPKDGAVSYESDNGQLFPDVNPQTRKGGSYSVLTRNTRLFTGFLHREDGADVSVGSPDLDIQIIGKTRLDWATISAVSMNGNGFDPADADGKPIRILLTATGQMLNTDMTIRTLDGNKITCGNRWGKEPVLCEGIPMKIVLEKAENIRCFPLDESGNRRRPVPADGNAIELGPQYKTIWYEIEIDPV